MDKRLTSLQETILLVASRNAGCYSRSGLAKLLVGTGSARAAGLSDDPDYGCLAGHGRKAITFEIDILIQQGFLTLGQRQYVVLGPNFP